MPQLVAGMAGYRSNVIQGVATLSLDCCCCGNQVSVEGFRQRMYPALKSERDTTRERKGPVVLGYRATLSEEVAM